MPQRRRPTTIPIPVVAHATQAAWARSPRDGMLMEFLLETACRNTETRLMEVGDVWKGDDIVMSLAIRAEIAKNGRRRAVALSGPFRQKLRHYITGHRWNGTGPDLEAPLFPSTRGGRHLTRRGLARIVKTHLAAAGWQGTPHHLRHTAATELLRVSNARVVQIMLGHSRLDTVMIYTHPSDDDLRRAQEARRTATPPDV